MVWSYVIGIVVGCVVSNLIFFLKYKMMGTLLVDESDPENVKIRFVFKNDINFSKHKHVIFDIDNQANLSQK